MLRERVAIITGGASGVGRASALKFAEKGARIVIADINKDLGHELANQITHNNGTAVFLKTDVANADSVKNMIEETLNHFRTIDILYNNAAATTLCNTKDTTRSRIFEYF